MTIEKHEIKVSTTGSAGSATGSTVKALPLCELITVYLNYHASAPGTTDVTIKSPGNPASLTIATVSNNNTDGWYYFKVQDHNNVAAAVTGSYSDPPIHGNLQIDLAQADALTDALVATVYIRR
tara:strand:- start:157 stop:528 length:372 start_codon:yes stop_codon:yes gene_type:complete